MKKKRFLFICIFLFSLSLCFAKISFWDRIINGTREIKVFDKKGVLLYLQTSHIKELHKAWYKIVKNNIQKKITGDK